MHSRIKKIAYSALIIALAFALSKVKIIPMPLGGSVTLFSMLAISLPGYFFGVHYGFISAFIYSVFKLIFGGYVYTPIQTLFDYILSYSIFGISGISYKSEKKSVFIISYLIAVVVRFLLSSISGYVFFAEYAPEAWNPIVYTVVYNAGYIFTEAILTILVVSIQYVWNLLCKAKMKLSKY